MYKGTIGLWALLMENIPSMVNVTDMDIENYTNIIQETNAFEVGLQNEHAKKTNKYKLITQLLPKPEVGEGIFLPSDINSLRQRLKILLAEFNAGNRATRNEIVSIVDNLWERKKIQKEEVKEINNYITR